MSEKKPYEVETKAGKFYVQIASAERKTYTSLDGASVEEIRGRVRLSTDPEFEGDTKLGHLAIRGRKYAIDHYLVKYPKGLGYRGEDDFKFLWSNEAQWGGPYYTEKGQQVSRNAKAWDTLYALEREALDQFATENPDWERESTLRLFEYERDHHVYKLRNYEMDAQRERVRVAEWQARIDQLAVSA